MNYNSLSMRSLFFLVLTVSLASCVSTPERGEVLDHTPDQEGYYYQLVKIPIPDDVSLEVGGLDVMDDGRPVISTRRGEVWIVDDAYGQEPEPTYERFAHGLHEPLGLLVKDDVIYTAQRGELTKLIDDNGDEKADVYETVYAWPLTGNYHEYSYGPLELPNGNFFVSLNLAWVGYGASPAKWRGWGLEITPDGKMNPMAVGFRSPAGIGITSSGDIFYGENQGDWIGSGWISHIEAGDFLGHPGGLRWTNEESSPLQLAYEDIPNTGEPMYVAAREVPDLKLPAVWFPHTIMGISTSSIIEDNTGGNFGPFSGQLLVGDQGHSKLMRVFLEKVNGEYQGANFPFYEGFSSGILRTAWGKDKSLFVGQTSRGWAATGKSPYALERLVWTGNVPFEMKEIRAMPDGFVIVFTLPVDVDQASDASIYDLTSFTYKYHNSYGSPAINIENLSVSNVAVADDGLSVRLVIDGLREGYIHEFKLGELTSESGLPLLHDMAFYTLNNIPGNEIASANTSNESRSEGTQANNGAPAVKRQVDMPAEWGGESDFNLSIGTVPGLRFDTESFDVRAGSKVSLRFDNNDDMLHNLVLTLPGTVDDIAAEALTLGIRGQELNYVPDSDDVLFYTSLLEPETEETIYFTAPDEPGDYHFVCTFPGHSMTMRGILKVR